MMDRHAEIKGRLIAQTFFGELEKIAAPMSPSAVRSFATRAMAEPKRLAKTLGLRRLVPGTEPHRAFRASRQRANRVVRRARTVMKGRERQALQTLQTGTPSERTRAQRYLDELKQTKRPRRVTAFRDPRTIPDPPAPPKPKGSPVRRAAMIGGGGLLAAGGAYAGAKYLQSQRDPYAQYR